MHHHTVTALALLMLSSLGCQGIPLPIRSAKPAILYGDNPEIREKLLTQIPVGTSRAEAERRVQELGFEITPSLNLEPETGDQIHCRYTGRKGLLGEAIWLLQINCAEGKVVDIIVEQIGIE